ncbi:MAG: 23S rRNA (adenine(2503)-C(2))-methyltransferase RlmN, partial [Candidatus Omnitrophota bacterium]
ETVLISSGKRKTICLSTQIGCKYKCVFCASGKKGFVRNLTVSEILSQILYFQYIRGCSLTNYVFMGMGEPLDNYDNLSKAIMIMNSPDGMGIGARRITVSTAGVVPGINRLKELGLEVSLSVSLHSAEDKLRNELMPINKKYPLSDLAKACEEFFKETGRLITIEYILLKGINDSNEALMALVDITKRLRAKVNLIGYNKVIGVDFDVPHGGDMQRVLDFLIKHKVTATIRQSKGSDIDSACGQLAYRVKS